MYIYIYTYTNSNLLINIMSPSHQRQLYIYNIYLTFGMQYVSSILKGCFIKVYLNLNSLN